MINLFFVIIQFIALFFAYYFFEKITTDLRKVVVLGDKIIQAQNLYNKYLISELLRRGHKDFDDIDTFLKSRGMEDLLDENTYRR